MKLTNPTPDELRHAFAIEVAKYTLSQYGEYFTEAGLFVGSRSTLPPWDTSADAVLPWLEKTMWMAERTPPTWCHVALYGYAPAVHAEAATLPRAAVIALLRARGVEVEFTT